MYRECALLGGSMTVTGFQYKEAKIPYFLFVEQDRHMLVTGLYNEKGFEARPFGDSILDT